MKLFCWLGLHDWWYEMPTWKGIVERIKTRGWHCNRCGKEKEIH